MKPPWRSPSNPPPDPKPDPEGDSALQYIRSRLEPAVAELQRLVDTCSRRLEELGREQAELGVRMNELTMAVAEGIQHVDRAERRVKATVARARRQLEENGMESPGLEAEWAELRDEHDDGSTGRGMPPVREEVAEDPSRPISLGDAFPGSWTEGDLPSLME